MSNLKHQAHDPRWLSIGLIVLVTALAFARTLGGELVYDDHLLISRNPLIADLGRIGELFSSSYWDFLDPQTAQHVGYYRPLSMLALTLVYHAADAAPLGFHAASIILHAGAALGAWAVARRLFSSERTALWAALLFSLHPVHLESVAWISGISDPLAMCLGLPVIAGLLSRPGFKLKSGWLTGALFLAALCCKESAIGLFPVALVLGRLGKSAEERTPWKAYLPMLIALGVWYSLRVSVFGDLGAGFDRTTTEFGVSFARLLQLRVELLGGAALLLAFPLELNLFRAISPTLPFTSAQFLFPLIGALSLLLAARIAHKRGAHLVCALLLAIPAAFLPVLLRVESVGTFPLSDRFLYLAALGFSFLIAHAAVTRLSKGASTVALSCLALAYSAQDIVHAGAWADDDTLFRTALEQNPRNPNIHWSLGRILLEEFQETSELSPLREATAVYETGMELLAEARNSDFSIFASEDDEVQMNLGLGWCLLYAAEEDEFRDFDTPALIFQRVIDELDRVRAIRGVDPNSANRALALTGLGVTKMVAGSTIEASQAFRRAIDANAQAVEAHFNMGLLLLRKGLADQAVVHLRAALDSRPRHLRYMVALGVALERNGDDARARLVAMDALGYYPTSPETKALLGTLAAKRRNYDQAERWFTDSLRVNPNNGAAVFDLAKVYLAKNQFSDALPLLERACQMMTENFEAHYALGVIHYEAGEILRATPSLLNAFRLRQSGQAVRKLESLLDELRSDEVNMQWALAAIEYDRGALKESLRFCQRALGIAPNHGPSHYILGQVLARNDQPVEALEHFKVAGQMLPDDFQVQADCGVALAENGSGADAEPFLKRALELLPAQNFEKEAAQALSQRLNEALDGIREGG
jgi:tetratricopeptide (TPR) repeat protein